MAFTGTGAVALPAITPTGSAGNFTEVVYANLTGGTALATSPTITVSAAIAKVGVDMVMTSPTYDTATPKFGSAALSGGKGTATFTSTAANYRSFGFWFKCASSGATTATGPMFGDGTEGVGISSGNLYAWGPAGHNVSSVSVCDSTWHWLASTPQTDGNTVYHLDGGGQATYYSNVGNVANPTFFVTATGGTQTWDLGSNAAAPAGTEIDSVTILNGIQASIVTVPTAETTSAAANLLGAWGLNSSGTGQ